MISTSTGYKVIAIASLTYALFSCTAPVESQSNSEVLAKLEAIDAKIDALSSTLGQVYTAVQPNDAEIGACSIQEVIDQNFADCDPTRIPQDVAATPAVDTIFDPERTFEALTVIGQSNIADTCNVMGISATSRARSPALANQCARFGIYPNIQAQWDVAALVRQARDRVNQIYTASGMRNFMCSNIALGIFSPDC